ncbi:MAG: putative RDD family membrane protein YckC [Cycloclasticus pugetii]|jgi:uncharacterized RDD family membrane protein YckC|uniref:RDD family protein n=1 Tax=Cycloclasticus TaxID=34067 RepID=UPI000286AE26|nr:MULTISPECIES: RDD family protein [Cycloclasticus]AFT66441.1 RDD domain containing protein [Cycloclasticus sp. P1]MBV1898690.1 RDD family protein [Cycloclasticus sp.]MDF1829650.1 RDD family protein [Cycloclasticus pugetii]PHR51643.1 MAG: RDD family protein [Cycloclasticus sp.]|tara:strand:+ start:933 stop:1388 length:456 start_codon:yes stop_codon:yes gene_type:complete
MPDLTKPPGLLRRLAIITYDALLLIAILFLATLVLLPFQDSHLFQPNSWLYSLYLLSVSFLFYGWFWTKSGQTLGLLAWKLKIANNKGQNISWRQALIRFTMAILSWGVLGLGVLWILVNKDRLSWHDIASNSRLIWVEKEPSAHSPDGED